MRNARNLTRVHELFSAIRKVVPPAAGDPWLTSLEREAERVQDGWQDRFDGYIHGLVLAGQISSPLGVEWMKDARRCSTPAIRVEHALFLVLWTLLVTLTTLAWQSKQFGAPAATVGGLIVAVIGGLWAHRMNLAPAVSPEVPASKWKYLCGLTVLAASAGTVGIFLPAFMGLMAQLAAYKTFFQQQQAFETDPEGLPWIRKFAKREFNADVVMVSSQDSWSRTALQLIGSSPAFMSTGNALCELSISRESILSTFPIRKGLDPNLWVHGIMMHELSHCLDVRRDFQGPAGSWTNTLSIAPVDRKGIGDGPSYYDV